MKLLVGIVTYNSRRTIHRCLVSLLDSIPQNTNFQIVIHDNNSSDNSAGFIRENYQNIPVISSHQNNGYSYGVNRISEYTQWDYFLILNPDVYLEKSALKSAIYLAFSNKTYSLIGANLLNESNESVHSFGDLPTPEMFVYDFSGYRKFNPKSNWSTYKKVISEKQPFEVGYVSGAFMLIKNKAWIQVGSFDESFFLYFEDTDWAYRLNQSGLKAVVHPDVRAVHESGASFELNDESEHFKLKCYFTSAYKFMKKHYGNEAMKTVHKEIIRYATIKLKTLTIVGMRNSSSAKRQKLILTIHDEIKKEIF